jgi:hypothetical protein
MSFKQAFYTSCEKGLGGGKGFQFKAASTGIEPLLFTQIERLGLYVPPLTAPSRPTHEELKLFPVSLAFQLLGDGSAVLLQAKYIGVDYTDRYGNFFSHSLVSQNPYRDFCQNNQLLPIETWCSDTWADAQNDATELPLIENLRSGGDINDESIFAFLRDPARREMLPNFLTTVVEAIKTNRRLIIVDDNENIAFWIAVASYALPYRFVLKLTFNTYVRDPYQTEALITGTTEDTTFNFASHEIEHQFFVFDLKGSRFTPIERPSGFAAKVAFAYQHNYLVPRFAPFVEASAPDLPVEELEDAFAAYCYFENLDLPDVDEVGVLAWSSKYLKRLADKDLQSLLRKVVTQSTVEAKTLQAVTNFYLAILNAALDATATEQIRTIYFQWLISKAITTADIPILAATAKALPREVYRNEHAGRLLEEWRKNLKDSDHPARFAAALLIGDKLGFVETENNVLTWLGTEVSERWGADEDVQRAVCAVATRTGGKNLLEGIAANLVGKINDANLFFSLATLIGDPNAFAVLSDYAVKAQNIPLYLRLRGTQANLNSGGCEQTHALTSLLTEVKKSFGTGITPEITQEAFSDLWLNRTPTLEEAGQLLSPPLLGVIKKTDVPRRLVEVLSAGDGKFSTPDETDLIDKLLAPDVLGSLGDKAPLVKSYRLAATLQNDFSDPDGTQLVEHLNWLEKIAPLIPSCAPDLYRLLGQKTARVQTVGSHVRLLSEQLRKENEAFLEAYESESQLVIRTKKNNPEVILMVKAWLRIIVNDERLLNKRLNAWLETLEEQRGKKEISELEKSLAAEAPELDRMWLSLKEERKKNRPGLWGRLAGNVFSRR